jgi:hypothetical protein
MKKQRRGEMKGKLRNLMEEVEKLIKKYKYLNKYLKSHIKKTIKDALEGEEDLYIDIDNVEWEIEKEIYEKTEKMIFRSYEKSFKFLTKVAEKSLRDAFTLAKEDGYKIEDIDSRILANLLIRQILLEQMENFIAELKDLLKYKYKIKFP